MGAEYTHMYVHIFIWYVTIYMVKCKKDTHNTQCICRKFSWVEKVIYCMIQFMNMRNNKILTILKRLVPRYWARRKQIWEAMFRILDVIMRTRGLLDCFPHLGEKNGIKHIQIHFIMPCKFMWIYNYLIESFTKKWNHKCNFKNMYFLQSQTVTFCYPCSDGTGQKSQGTCLNCCWQYSF